MTLFLGAACLWTVAANVIAMFPSRRKHWPAAYALMVFGLPILVGVLYQNGPWVALLVLVAMMSILRWPVFFLWKWIKERLLS